ncbi:hypothetical protein BDV28DRAFT_61315 [Aspergillus coremiiformis]|uniref:Uncharacterized protein n=1 Tax=Aspergillus coremiiformis TaxID=138285 RepID=A0A5N6YWW3_9EURO|nr:hypothetical protein BDV28DRAFT_61315 [Aspergillus coremiiformis]
MPLHNQDYVLSSCHSTWDSANARLSSCAMRYFSIIPGIIVLIIGLGRALSCSSLTRRPKWMRPFILEEPPCPELPSERPRQRTGWAMTLLAISTIGFAAELMKVVPHRSILSNIMPLVPWVSPERSLAQPKLNDHRQRLLF